MSNWYEEKYFEKLKRLDPQSGMWYLPYGDVFGFVEQLITSVDVWLTGEAKRLFKPPEYGLSRLTYSLYAQMIASIGRDAENVTEAIHDWIIDTIVFMRQVLYIGDVLYEFAIRHVNDCVHLIVEIIYTAVMSHDVYVPKDCVPTLVRLLREHDRIPEDVARYLADGFVVRMYEVDGQRCYAFWKVER